MGSVTSNITRITGAETADAAAWEDIGSGPGSAQSAEVFIQGAEARARRTDNATKGQSIDITTGVDISEPGSLVGWWLTCLQPSQIDDDNTQPFEVRVGSDTSATANYDSWNAFRFTNFPDKGGWQRVWVNINEITPDGGAGTPNYASLRHFGMQSRVGDVAGTAPNLIVDAIDYLSGHAAAHILTGSNSVFQDFVDFDEGDSNQKDGVWESRSAVFYCAIRSQIGDAGNPVTFDDSGFQITFPRQQGPAGTNLINAGANGLLFDMRHASSTVVLQDGFLKSQDFANTPGDFIVSGTSPLTATRLTMNQLRTIQATSGCSFINCVITDSGQINAGPNGAEFDGTTIANSRVGSGLGAFIWDVNDDPDGQTDGMKFEKANDPDIAPNHAMEFGVHSPTSITLRDMVMTNYNAAHGNLDSTFWVRRTTGIVTINIVNGSGNFSYRSDGATVTVQQTVTLTVNVEDQAGDPIENARVTIIDPTGTELMNELTTAAGQAVESYNYISDTNITVRVRSSSGTPAYFPVETTGQITNQGFTLDVVMREDNIIN